MPIKRRLITISVLVLAVNFWPKVASAEDADPIEWQRQGPLEIGMDSREVLSAWGPPKSRLEHETAREEIWEYPRGRAVISLGKLKAWDLPDLSSQSTPIPSPGPKAPLGKEYRVEDILGDLLKTQAPAEDDSKTEIKKLPIRPKTPPPVGRGEGLDSKKVDNE